MAGLLIDTGPLRVSRDFRLLFVGQAISYLGGMITMAALPYQVFHATNSSVDVGLLGLAQLGPMLVCGLLGGALADAIDKRTLLVVLGISAMATSALLAVNAALSHPQIWAIYLLGVLSTSIGALLFPVMRSLLPLLLEPDQRPAAFTLQATYGSFGMMAGPAVGGLLIGAFGLKAAYSVDVATYVVALCVYLRIAPSPPVAVAGARRTSIVEGLRFLRGHSLVMSIFGIDLLAMIFGMPRALFPALSERLGGGPLLYGLLLSSVAAGAFLASLTSGWTARIRRYGRAVVLSVCGWGAAIAVAGLVRTPAIVLLALLAAGGADMISGVYRSTIAAAVTPDELRGRVSGVEFAVYAGGPVLGDVEAGVVGGLVSVPFAIVSGGIACVVAALAFAGLVPDFASYVADVET
ncbi:MAG TPA: MFS transporter [Acidimicrobiales bacterium]|nr:MFS transporter [Acidimicrobiales bacterium]